MTRKSTPTSPAVVVKKMSLAQLQEIVESQELMIKKLKEDAEAKDILIKSLEGKIVNLQGQVSANLSLQYVRDRVTDELKEQLVNLQQYTRRYSTIITGIEKIENESQDSLKKEVEAILAETNSGTSMNEVDKLHRVGPKRDNVQDIIVRFKSHTAKENFYRNRKQIKRRGVKVRPSLTPARRELLDEANEVMKDYETRDYQLNNMPHFVYADLHGNLKLKMAREVKGRLFFNFKSLVELNNLIEKNQEDE